MTTTTAPTRQFRIIRGEGGGYRSHTYTSKQRRDEAARRFAAEDGSPVVTERWHPDHPQDELNQGWACDGAEHPPGEPTPDTDEPTGRRGVAAHIVPGDTVTVWAAQNSHGKPGFVTGRVNDVSRGASYYGVPARILTVLEGPEAAYRVLTVVDTAVTYWKEDPAALLAEFDAWREDRADLSAAEDDGGADWSESDDQGCDLAQRLAEALRALTTT